MPAARKVCGQPQCPHLLPCPDHPKVAWAASTRKTRLPPSRAWERLRLTVIERDPICQVCHQAISTEVDHIDPGDNHALTNLQGICAPCHQAKTQTEAAAGRSR